MTILFAAPGAGLGHLVRASAVGLALERLALKTRIVTNSPYAAGLGRLTGLTVDHLPSRRWPAQVRAYAAALKPTLVVLDAFPFGLRGEWRDPPPGLRFALLARRLKVRAYLEAAGVEWDPAAPTLERIIQIEPLGEDLLGLLALRGTDPRTLTGRIRFPAGDFPTPVPGGLAEVLDSGRAWLVVHSGPEKEVRRLWDLAAADLEKNGGGRLAAILPRETDGIPGPVFEYFPAARLYNRAFRVITGAGYNSLAEAALEPEKHLLCPFTRRYDDQAARLAGPPPGPGDGAMEAARLLAEW
ncbi:MAG: hypothetical protein AB1896_20600 [Thermodesulfobacteriota bacterium]